MSLDFGQVRLGQPSAALPVTVTNTGGGTLTISNVTFEPPGVPTFILSGNTCGGGVPAGQSCTLSVSFTPFATGPAASILRIESNSAIPAASVGLSGTGTAPAVALTPSALTFGATTIGASSPAQAVTLQNTGSAPLAVVAVTALGDFGVTSACPTTPATLAPSASCEIAVTFAPGAPGARTGTLTVMTDATDSPHLVGLAGDGVVAPVAGVSPASRRLRRRSRRHDERRAAGDGDEHRRRHADGQRRLGEPRRLRGEQQRLLGGPGLRSELRSRRDLRADGDGFRVGSAGDPDECRPDERDPPGQRDGARSVAVAGEPRVRPDRSRRHDRAVRDRPERGHGSPCRSPPSRRAATSPGRPPVRSRRRPSPPAARAA